MAGQELELSLAPTLWEWKRGEGYTLPITHDRKAQIASVLAERRFLKIVRFVPMTDPRLQAGLLPDLSREALRSMLPIVTADGPVLRELSLDANLGRLGSAQNLGSQCEEANSVNRHRE